MKFSQRFCLFLLNLATCVLLSEQCVVAQDSAPIHLTEPGKVPISSKDLIADVDEVKLAARQLSAAFRAASTRVMPSVVVVLAKRADVNQTLDRLELLDDSATNFNAGSGVILSPDGLIVTNSHVVADTNDIRIRLSDGREFIAKDVKADKTSDLAILKISVPEPLPAIKVGDSANVSVGDWVIAVGSPFLLEQTVSAGIISGSSRILRGLVSGQLLQTDATINPGNSGGALANLDGELVGINTAIASSSGTFVGVGFAIPSKRMQWIVGELESRGSVRRAMLGVKTVDLPASVATKLNLPVRNGGAYVARVNADSPAANAGIESGDIILQIADQTVHNPSELLQTVEQLPIDQEVTVHLIRNEERKELAVKLSERK